MVCSFGFGFGNNWFGLHTSSPFFSLEFVDNIFGWGWLFSCFCHGPFCKAEWPLPTCSNEGGYISLALIGKNQFTLQTFTEARLVPGSTVQVFED